MEQKTIEELTGGKKGAIRIGPFGSALKKSEYSEAGIGVLGIEHVLPNRFCWETPKFIPDAKYEQLKQYTVDPGDVLVTNMGTVGRACVVPDGHITSIISSHLIKVTVDRSICEPAYLCWAVNNCPSVVRQIKATSHGAIMAGFNSSLLKELRVPVPSLERQKEIVAILDRADAVHRKREEAIGMAREFLRAVFLDMFGVPTINSKGWKVMTLGQICSDRTLVVDGPFGSSLKPECYVDSGVRVIRNFNIKDDWFDASQFKYVTEEKFRDISRSEARPGDLLISTKGTIGNVCLMPDLGGDNVLSASGTVRVRLPADCDLMGEFLVSQMVDPHFKSYIKSLEAGSNQKYLTLNAIRSLQVIVPPIEAQAEFCEAKARIKKMMGHLETYEQQAVALVDSLSEGTFSQSPKSSRELIVAE